MTHRDPFEFERPCFIHRAKEVLQNAYRMWWWKQVICPQCGERATFQDVMGTFWDSNAHHWRAAGPEEGRK